MGSHHDVIYEAILRGHQDDLEAQAQHRRMLALARGTGASQARGRRSRSDRVRCRLARTLVAVARRLDPEAATLPRSGRTPSRA